MIITANSDQISIEGTDEVPILVDVIEEKIMSSELAID